MCLQVHIHVCVYQRTTSIIIPQVPSTLFLVTGSLTNLERPCGLYWLARKPRGPPALPLSTRITSTCHHTSFCSFPHVLRSINTLLTEPSLQPPLRSSSVHCAGVVLTVTREPATPVLKVTTAEEAEVLLGEHFTPKFEQKKQKVQLVEYFTSQFEHTKPLFSFTQATRINLSSLSFPKVMLSRLRHCKMSIHCYCSHNKQQSLEDTYPSSRKLTKIIINKRDEWTFPTLSVELLNTVSGG